MPALTTAELERALRELLPPDHAARAGELARAIAGAAQGGARLDPALMPVLRSLAGAEVRSGGALISFGAGNQIGDVTIGDVVGRDQITIHLTLNLSQAPGAAEPDAKEAAEARQLQLQEQYSQAVNHLICGRLSEARRLYKMVLAEDPFYPSAEEQLEHIEELLAQERKRRLYGREPRYGHPSFKVQPLVGRNAELRAAEQALRQALEIRSAPFENVIVFTGPRGIGKSTLLNMIAEKVYPAEETLITIERIAADLGLYKVREQYFYTLILIVMCFGDTLFDLPLALRRPLFIVVEALLRGSPEPESSELDRYAYELLDALLATLAAARRPIALMIDDWDSFALDARQWVQQYVIEPIADASHAIVFLGARAERLSSARLKRRARYISLMPLNRHESAQQIGCSDADVGELFQITGGYPSSNDFVRRAIKDHQDHELPLDTMHTLWLAEHVIQQQLSWLGFRLDSAEHRLASRLAVLRRFGIETATNFLKSLDAELGGSLAGSGGLLTHPTSEIITPHNSYRGLQIHPALRHPLTYVFARRQPLEFAAAHRAAAVIYETVLAQTGSGREWMFVEWCFHTLSEPNGVFLERVEHVATRLQQLVRDCLGDEKDDPRETALASLKHLLRQDQDINNLLSSLHGEGGLQALLDGCRL